MKNYTDEIKWLQKRMDDNPNSILFARLAERYLKNNEIDQAIQICDRGLEFHPNYSTAYFVLAKCFFQKQEFDLAEKHLKKLLFIEPKHLLANKMFAELMSQLGWNKTAQSSIHQIQQIDPLETNIPSVSSETQIGKQEPGQADTSPAQSEPELEINNDSIENLFKSELDTKESDEEIESLFAGTFEEDMKDAFGLDDQKKATEKGLTDETVEALFEPGSDTSFETMVDEQSRSREADTFDAADTQDQDVPKVSSPDMPFENIEQIGNDSIGPEDAQVDTTADSFPLAEDESVFGFAGDNEATAVPDESPELETLADGEEEETDGSAFPAAYEDVEEQPATSFKTDNELLAEDEAEEDLETEKYPEQEDRYSNILDGIFSPGVDDEERKEMEAKSQMGQDADDLEHPFADESTETSDDIFSIPEDELEEGEETATQFEEKSEKESGPELSPEDLIISNATETENISAQPEEEPEEQSPQEPVIPEGYLAFEEDESVEDLETDAVHMQDMNQEDTDQDFDEEEELGQFLAGLGESDEDEEPEEPETDKEIYDSIFDEALESSEKQTQTAEPEDDEQDLAGLTAGLSEPEIIKESPEETPVVFQGPEESPVVSTEPEDAGQAEQRAEETEPHADATPKDKFVTPTLGEIYAAQGQYAKAINVFELLQEKQPDNEYYKTKLEYLKKKLDEINN